MDAFGNPEAHFAELPVMQRRSPVRAVQPGPQVCSFRIAEDRVRIVYIIAALVPGGAEKQLLLLLENLDRSRYSAHVIAFASGLWEDRFQSLGVPIEIIPYEQGKVAVIARCWSRLRQLRPDIVHTYGTSANYAGRAAAIAARVPVVIAGERTAPFIKSRWQLAVDRVMSPFTDLWIANSAHAAQFYSQRRIASESQVAVVYNGIDATVLRVAHRSNESPRIGTVAALRPEKNFGDLFRAMAAVVSRSPSTTLHIGGDGPIRAELERETVERGIGPNVVFHGWINRIGEFLTGMDMYVHTAHYEGFPNSVMEAMAAGLPCIAYATTGCQELIRDQETGLLVPTGDWEAIARAIVRILEAPGLASRLGHNARAAIERDFSIPQMVQATSLLYEQALSRNV